MIDYPFKTPKAEYIDELYTDLKDVWRTRNTFIEEMRQMLVGENTIDFPANTQYKIRTMHTYMLASIVNEKAARFSHLPVLQVIPEVTEDIDAERKKSSNLERALEIAQYEMERHGDGDVWSRVIMDAITLDEGVERIERAPAAFWPELTAHKLAKSKGEDSPFEHIFEKKFSEDDYKKLKGIPLRSVYIPLENYLPVLEGSTAVEVLQVEERTLRSVMRNKLFDSEAVAQLRTTSEGTPSIKDKVTILHYNNQNIYAYFALGQSTGNNNMGELAGFPNGQPVLLHAYTHGIGRVIYNSVAGRFGGWKSATNKVEGISKALIALNQHSDEIMSQVLTNVRARYWPTHVHKIDSDRRGYQSGSPPKPTQVPEGQNLAIFKDESIDPLFKAEHDEAVPWLMDQIQAQMSQLAGSSTLFGNRTPGVETGYHQSLQITQAEHLDEKIQQHVSWGAIQRGTIMMKHIGKIGSIVVNHIETDATGKTSSTSTKITREMVSPAPRLSAQVRKPRPIDFSAAIRSARDITDERGGKGALASDDFAREQLLGITQPDIELRKLRVERERRILDESGIISLEIQKALAMQLAQESAPNVGPADAAKADSSLIEAISTPLTRGQPAGQSQPEAAVGREIAGAQPEPIVQ